MAYLRTSSGAFHVRRGSSARWRCARPVPSAPRASTRMCQARRLAAPVLRIHTTPTTGPGPIPTALRAPWVRTREVWTDGQVQTRASAESAFTSLIRDPTTQYSPVPTALPGPYAARACARSGRLTRDALAAATQSRARGCWQRQAMMPASTCSQVALQGTRCKQPRMTRKNATRASTHNT